MPRPIISAYGLLGAVLLTGGVYQSVTGGPYQDQTKTASAAAEASKGVVFVDSQPLIVSQIIDKEYVITFFVRNDGGTARTLSFSAELTSDQGKIIDINVAAKTGAQIDPHQTRAVTLGIPVDPGLAPLSGYVRMKSDAPPPGTPLYTFRTLQVLPVLPSSTATDLMLAAIISALAVVLISVIWLKRKGIGPLHRMGSPTWSFGDSWGSNIAVGGALLTALLGLSALPQQTHFLNKSAYVSLSLIFSGLITLAPSVYNLLRSPVNATNNSGATVAEYQGYVVLFALASGLTMWAALGQLAAVGFLFAELSRARQISRSVELLLVAVVSIVGGLMLAYGYRTICHLAQAQKAAGDTTTQRVNALGGALPAAFAPSLPNWHLI